MFLPIIVIGILVALIRGGSVRGDTFRIGGWELVVIGFLIRAVLYDPIDIFGVIDHKAIMVMQALGHAAIISGIFKARVRPSIGMWVIKLGVVANAAVILANNGRMPVAVEALRYSGQDQMIPYLASGASNTHQLLDASTRLPWLADIFALPAWWPLAVAFSVGDVLIAAGAFIFIQHAMGAGRPRPPVLQ